MAPVRSSRGVGEAAPWELPTYGETGGSVRDGRQEADEAGARSSGPWRRLPPARGCWPGRARPPARGPHRGRRWTPACQRAGTTPRPPAARALRWLAPGARAEVWTRNSPPPSPLPAEAGAWETGPL